MYFQHIVVKNISFNVLPTHFFFLYFQNNTFSFLYFQNNTFFFFYFRNGFICTLISWWRIYNLMYYQHIFFLYFKDGYIIFVLDIFYLIYFCVVKNISFNVLPTYFSFSIFKMVSLFLFYSFFILFILAF